MVTVSAPQGHNAQPGNDQSFHQTENSRKPDDCEQDEDNDTNDYKRENQLYGALGMIGRKRTPMNTMTRSGPQLRGLQAN